MYFFVTAVEKELPKYQYSWFILKCVSTNGTGCGEIPIPGKVQKCVDVALEDVG